MTPEERRLRRDGTRLWLEFTLREPMPAREVFRLGALEGIPVKGLKRAKRHLRVKSVKVGGRRQGWGAVWMWQCPCDAWISGGLPSILNDRVAVPYLRFTS
jgi:hypothetical protein